MYTERTRKFSGKIFALSYATKDKSEAEKTKKWLKERGFLARITKQKGRSPKYKGIPLYLVWEYDKTGAGRDSGI
jgi:hypothetical protein